MGRKKKQSKIVYLSNRDQADLLAGMLKDQNSLTTDLVLYCNGGQVEAHSFILAYRSEVFRAALEDFPKGFQFAVSMPGMRVEMAQCLINFIYTGSLVILGKYVDAFSAILEELKIVVNIGKEETEENEGNISIFAPLVKEDDQSDEELEYFPVVTPETPKKRKLLKIGGKQGRPRKMRLSRHLQKFRLSSQSDFGNPPSQSIEETERAENAFSQLVEEAEQAENASNQSADDAEQTENLASDMETIYSQEVSVVVDKDEDENRGDNENNTAEDNPFASVYFSNDDEEGEGAVSADDCTEHLQEEIEEKNDEEPRKINTRRRSVHFELCDGSGDERDDNLDPDYSEHDTREEKEIDSEEEKEKNAKKPKLRKRLRAKKASQKNDETDERQFSCSICKIEFLDKRKLKEHYSTHKKGDFYFCSICSQRFRAFSVLAVHNRKHTGEKPFKCPYCEREFAHQASYDTHLNIHTGEKPYGCQECGKGFHNRAAYYAHTCDNPIADDGDPLRFQCRDCHRRFKSRVALGRHKSIHKDSTVDAEKTVLCELCGRGFTTVPLLKQHLKYHSDIRPFSCDVCGKGFFSRATLENHSRSHSQSDLNFVCGVCKKVFRSPELLDRHHRSVHSDERSFACDVCTETFRLRSQLENHMLLHTSNIKYECHCGKLFLNPKYLHKHKLTHIKLIRCVYCRKAFVTAEERDSHEQLHRDGTLPITKNNAVAKSLKSLYFNCSDCKECFKSQEELDDHLVLHRYVEEEDVIGGMETEHTEGEQHYEQNCVPMEQTEQQVFFGEQVVVVSANNTLPVPMPMTVPVPVQPTWGLHYVVMTDKNVQPTQVVTFGSM